MTSTRTAPRAETVGSLLRPPELTAAYQAVADGTADRAALRAAQDEAVRAAITVQEAAGLDVICDGEMRRTSWAFAPNVLNGIEPRTGPRAYPANVRLAKPDTPFPTVVARPTPNGTFDVGADFTFLRENSRTRGKYTIAAPSYHRRYWSDTHSTAAYGSCTEFLLDIRDWVRDVARHLMAAGCDYLQLDAPNYGSLCDPQTRAFHEDAGHNVSEDIAFDAWLDSSVFEGLDGVTSALHVCRGNFPGGEWHSSGGYAAIAEELFSAATVDTLLLEYDSERAGDFTPLRHVRPGTVCVLGLLTTKSNEMEDAADIVSRIEEATAHKPLDELALSTQCGFASVARDNPTTVESQRAKLELVSTVARQVWD